MGWKNTMVLSDLLAGVWRCVFFGFEHSWKHVEDALNFYVEMKGPIIDIFPRRRAAY